MSEFVEAAGMRSEEVLLGGAELKQHPAQNIEKSNIAARCHTKMVIGFPGRRRSAGVGHDDIESRPGLLRSTDPVKCYRVRLGHVTADDEDHVGQIDVVVAAWRAVTPQAGSVAGYGRRHAEPAIRVRVVCADVPLEKLAGEVGGFRVELAAAIEGDRFRPRGADNIM